MSSRQIYFFCFFCFLGSNDISMTYSLKTGIDFIKNKESKPPKGKHVYNYGSIDSEAIAFIYQKRDTTLALVYKSGAIQNMAKNSRFTLDRIVRNKNFIKGKCLGRVAYANADDIAFFEWNHQENRTYLHFSKNGGRYFFDAVKPASLIAQLSGINREYIMPSKNKNYINILHFIKCNEDNGCNCYSRTISIDCSCENAKKINKKIDELKTS